MPDLLPYRPSDHALFYRPPSRVDLGRTVVGYVAAAATVTGLASGYGAALPAVTSIATRMATVAAAVLMVGLAAGIPIRFGRVRIPILAAGIGVSLAAVAVYVMWVAWVHQVLLAGRASVPVSRLATRPVPLLALVVHLGRAGTWAMDGEPMNGPPLYGLWLFEAGLFLSAGTLIPIRMRYASAPVCPDCRRITRRAANLPRFDGRRQAQLISAVEGRAFDALVGLPAAPDADAPELSLALMSCPSCGHLNVLTVSRIAWRGGGKRRAGVQIAKLLDGLLLTGDEAARLRAACGQVVAARTATATARVGR